MLAIFIKVKTCTSILHGLWINVNYLLYKVHAFGRLHSVCIVNYVRDVIFGTHRGQLLKPTRKSRTNDKVNVVITGTYESTAVTSQTSREIKATCRGPAGRSRTLLNERTGRSQVQAPRSCARLLPSLSATHRPREHSPPPPVQSLIKQSGMSNTQRHLTWRFLNFKTIKNNF